MNDDKTRGPNYQLSFIVGHEDQQFYDLVEKTCNDPDKANEIIRYYDAISNPETKARIRRAFLTVFKAMDPAIQNNRSKTLH